MRWVTGVLLVLCVILIPGSTFAEDAKAERIKSYEVTITLPKDGTFRVTERITYDFGDNERHGIHRVIPFVLRGQEEGRKYRLDFVDVTAADDTGKALPLAISEENERLRLRIGDSDVTVSGEHVYVLSYIVRGGIRYFPDWDELYWNATGNDWSAPIESAVVRVVPEFPLDPAASRAICYTGAFGSTEQDCTVSFEEDGVVWKLSEGKALGTGEGITVALTIPKGVLAVAEAREYASFWESFAGRLTIIALLVCAALWYIVYPIWLGVKWMIFGHDPRVGRDLAAAFEPPKTKSGRKLTPAETGTIIDETVHIRDIAAMLVSLAQRGYLKIEEREPKDFYCIRTKEPDDSLLEFERLFLHGLFGTQSEARLKDQNLFKTVAMIEDEMYRHMQKEGFFPHNPKAIRAFYSIMMGLAGTTFNLPLLASGALFGMNMVRKTLEGAKAASHVRSLRNFLKSQERQLSFQGDRQIMFEKMLPYAVAFGIEREWVERFKDAGLRQPAWFSGRYDGGFTPRLFANSLNASIDSFADVSRPPVSRTGHSSGFSGGSSGGGGGGGGGGSW